LIAIGSPNTHHSLLDGIKVAEEFSEDKAKEGGNLGWMVRGKDISVEKQ
jgi:hypothetical protein